MSIGVLLPHLGASQASFLAIQEISKLKEDSVLFFEELSSPCLPVRCATICINELMSFSGTLITTNIRNTMTAASLVNRKQVKLIFYVWDLEWLRPGKNDYLYNLQAYNDVDVLIARHTEHIAPIKNYSNREPIMIEDFDLEEIMRC